MQKVKKTKTFRKLVIKLMPSEIFKIAKEAKRAFPYKAQDIEFFIMGKSKFCEYLENSYITKDHKEDYSKTPAFVAHLKKNKNVIVFCDEIINKLSKKLKEKEKEELIKALTTHELFHIINKHSIENEYEALKSEEEVHEEFEEEFPEYKKILDKFS